MVVLDSNGFCLWIYTYYLWIWILSIIDMMILIINYFSYGTLKKYGSIVDFMLCKVHIHKNIVHFLLYYLNHVWLTGYGRAGNHHARNLCHLWGNTLYMSSCRQTVGHARHKESPTIVSVQIKYGLEKCPQPQSWQIVDLWQLILCVNLASSWFSDICLDIITPDASVKTF